MSEPKDWHVEAHRLFGFSLLCSNNHNAVARAWGEIAAILNDFGEVEITVRRIPEDAADESCEG